MNQSPYLPLKDKDFTTACCGYHSGNHGVTFKLLSEAVRLSLTGLCSTWANISFSRHTTYSSARATTLCPLDVFCLCPDTCLYFCGFLVAFSAENAPLLCPAVFIYDLMFSFMSSPCLIDCAKPLCLIDLFPHWFFSPPKLFKLVGCAHGWGAKSYFDTYNMRLCYITLYISFTF